MRQPQLIDDERLGRLVTNGNSRAFSVLYERYHGILYRYCRSILHSDADAHDVVQSTFTRALEAMQRGQRDAPVRPWLFRIAHNEAISLLRRRSVSDRLATQAPSQGISFEDRARAREELRSLMADLQELPEGPRGAIVLRELSGLSHDEIATTLGTSTSAVKHAIHEARKALTELARGRQMDCRDVRRDIEEGDRRVLRSRRIRAHLSDCAECAGLVAAAPHRSQRLRALPPLGGMSAFRHLLVRRVHPGAFSAGAQDTAFATSTLGATAAKLTALLGTKVVTAGVIAAGAATVGLTYDFNRADAPAPRAAPLGSTQPDPSEAGRRTGVLAKPMTSSFGRVGRRQTLISIPESRSLRRSANRGVGWQPGTTGNPSPGSVTRGSTSSTAHAAMDHRPEQARGVRARPPRSPNSRRGGAHGSPRGRGGAGTTGPSRGSTGGAAAGHDRGTSRGFTGGAAARRDRATGKQSGKRRAGAPAHQPGTSTPVEHAPPRTKRPATASKPAAPVGQVPRRPVVHGAAGAVARRAAGHGAG